MKPKFLIAAPQYSHQSGGIMVLHNLCDMLNRQGFEAALVFFHGGAAPNFQWAASNNPDLYHPDYLHVDLSMSEPDKAVREFLEDGIMIYPDLVMDNPLGAKRIVRYILCHNESYTPTDPMEFVLSFSRMFHNRADGYLLQALPDPNFYKNNTPHWSKRTMDLTYYGKGPSFTTTHRIPETLVVTRTWPEDKNQLGILFRQCRFLFTWDSVSQTNFDAIACGAVPVFLHDKQTTWEALSLGELGAYPRISLANKMDKESVVCDPIEVDRQMQEMTDKINWHVTSWPDRVRQFALQAEAFFAET